MTVITDMNGKFLGAVRNGEIKDGTNTLTFHALPDPNHQHHEIEVDEELMHKPFDEVRKVLVDGISRG